MPAERPAIVSTSAGERRAWFSFISKGGGLVLSWRICWKRKKGG